MSRHEHKQYYFAKNDGNYCYAIYEGVNKKGKEIKEYRVVNNFEAGKYFTSNDSNGKQPLELNIIDKNENILILKFLLKTGTLVLFYEHEKNEVHNMVDSELSKRLYKTVAIESDGRVQFRHHTVARPDGELKKSSSVNFDTPNEKLRISKSGLNILVQGYDFKITASGKVDLIN